MVDVESLALVCSTLRRIDNVHLGIRSVLLSNDTSIIEFAENYEYMVCGFLGLL